MARKVDAFPEIPGQSRYPWDEWLDGSIWELTEGEDFRGKVNTFRSNARSQARRRNGKVEARILRKTDEPNKIYIRFVRA